MRIALVSLLLAMLSAGRVVAAACTVDSAASLQDVLVALDDGLGGAKNGCLNASGVPEIALSGTVALDAPLVVDLGDGLDLHGPAAIVPSLQYKPCSATACPACAITLLKWDHRLHDLTISGFPHGGICAEGSGHLIHHVTVKDVVGDGFRLEGENSSAVWNTVQGTHGDGIAIYDTSNLALQNTIGGYDHYGLALYGTGFLPDLAAAILASNTILPGTDDGQCSNYGPCTMQTSAVAARWSLRQNATEPVSAAANPDVPMEAFSMVPQESSPLPIPDSQPTPPATDEEAHSDRMDQPPAAGCTLIRNPP